MRIGIDLGGTKTEGVLLDATGAVVARERRPTPRDAGYARIVEGVVDLVRTLEARADVPCTVGVGIPGTLDAATGRVKNANTTELIGQPLVAHLREALAREVRIQNDANCFAVAEATSGAAQGYDVVFGVILGTGVGGGLVCGGRVRTGRHGIAGEWGHSPIEDRADDAGPTPRCYCGQRGCLEMRISGSALTRDHARLAGHAEACRDAADVFARAEQGEAAARRAVTRYVGFLAEALARVFHIVDPDAVVLGGGLSNADVLYERLPGEVASVLFNPRLEAPILRHALGDSAGVFGAAWLWP